MGDRFIVQGLIPGVEAIPGEVIELARGKDKLLALRLIKPLPRGSATHHCECGSRFATADAHTQHKGIAHPKPQPKAKVASVEPPAIKPETAQQPESNEKEDTSDEKDA